MSAGDGCTTLHFDGSQQVPVCQIGYDATGTLYYRSHSMQDVLLDVPSNLMSSFFAAVRFWFWFRVFIAKDFLAYCCAEVEPRTLSSIGTEGMSRPSVDT